MALGGDARAAGGIDTDVFLGVECLCEEGVGDDADVGAEPDELDFVVVRERGGEIGRAEGGLFEDGGRLPHEGLECIRDLPPCRAANAVLDGQFLPLLRREVVRAVGVHGKDEHRARRLLRREFFHETRQHLLRLGRPERPVNKVVLHIYDNKCLAHKLLLHYFIDFHRLSVYHKVHSIFKGQGPLTL